MPCFPVPNQTIDYCIAVSFVAAQAGACVTSPCTALPLTNFYVELSCPTSYPTAAPSGFGGQVSFSNTSCDPTQANLATFLKTGVCASFGSGSYFVCFLFSSFFFF